MERFTKSERNVKISSKPYSSTSTWGLFIRTAISLIHQPEGLRLFFKRKAKAIKSSWAGVGFGSGRRISKKFLFIQPLTDCINLIQTRNYVYSHWRKKWIMLFHPRNCVWRFSPSLWWVSHLSHGCSFFEICVIRWLSLFWKRIVKNKIYVGLFCVRT